MERDTEVHADALISKLASADATTWKEIGAKLSQAAPPDARAALIEGSATGLALGLEPPSSRTRDWLWSIAVAAFTFVLVASVLAIIAGVFVGAKQNPVVKSDLLLSVFTAAVGFLGGLFVPSPSQKQAGQ